MAVDVPGLKVSVATTDSYPGDEVLGSSRSVPYIDLMGPGYWDYDARRAYRARFDPARYHVDLIEAIARRVGITLALKLHPGFIRRRDVGTSPNLVTGRLRAWLRCFDIKTVAVTRSAG
jgi:hypothetical protein